MFHLQKGLKTLVGDEPHNKHTRLTEPLKMAQ